MWRSSARSTCASSPRPRHAAHTPNAHLPLMTTRANRGYALPQLSDSFFNKPVSGEIAPILPLRISIFKFCRGNDWLDSVLSLILCPQYHFEPSVAWSSTYKISAVLLFPKILYVSAYILSRIHSSTHPHRYRCGDSGWIAKQIFANHHVSAMSSCFMVSFLAHTATHINKFKTWYSQREVAPNSKTQLSYEHTNTNAHSRTQTHTHTHTH